MFFGDRTIVLSSPSGRGKPGQSATTRPRINKTIIRQRAKMGEGEFDGKCVTAISKDCQNLHNGVITFRLNMNTSFTIDN